MRLVMAGVLALSLGGLALALDDPKPGGEQPKSRADRLKALRSEPTPSIAEYRKALEAAKTAEEKTAAARTYNQKLIAARRKVAEEALKLVEEDAKDDVGLEALKILLSGTDMRARDKARALVLEHHLTKPGIESMIPTLARQGRAYDVTLLKTIIEKNPARPVKAMAAFTVAQSVKAEAEGSKVKDAEIEAKQAEAIQAFEALAAEYGDVQVTGLRGKVADAARAVIEEIKKSPVGKVTPEIEGEDIDGVNFKLSDYRGKVVLLDFWGHW
jgi:hypothetical protein